MEKLKRRLALLEDEEEEDKSDHKEEGEEDDEEDLVKEVRKAYRGHKIELKRLKEEHDKLVSNGTQSEKRRTFKKLMRDAGEAWEEVVTQQDILDLIEAFVVKVTVEWVSPQFYILTIYWKDDEWEIDRAVCFKGGCPSPHWSKEEEALLREHYPTASGEELMRLFPSRSLNAICVHATRCLKIRRLHRGREYDITANVKTFCLQDCEQIEMYGLTEEELQWYNGGKQVTPWINGYGGNFTSMSLCVKN